jgi:hypothetical protein
MWKISQNEQFKKMQIYFLILYFPMFLSTTVLYVSTVSSVKSCFLQAEYISDKKVKNKRGDNMYEFIACPGPTIVALCRLYLTRPGRTFAIYIVDMLLYTVLLTWNTSIRNFVSISD